MNTMGKLNVIKIVMVPQLGIHDVTDMKLFMGQEKNRA